jgi:ferredoxin
MKWSTVNLIYFSPTQTTQKIVQGIAQGIPFDQIEHFDLTQPDAETRVFPEINQGLTILATPVYAGRVPIVAVRRLQRIKAQGAPVLVVVVYGNREFEDALLELKNIAIDQGFIPVAAGAFIGEHSYSTAELPIANGRPDEADLKKARELGETVFKKLKSLSIIDEKAPLEVPGNFPYKERTPHSNESPLTQETLCTLCGTCASVCPTEAVIVNETVVTEAKRCILCQACVKNCPSGARINEVPRIKQVTQWLNSNCSKRKEPVLFV